MTTLSRVMRIIVTLMVVLGIACNTLSSSTAPKWSEAEAIAVVKNWCYPEPGPSQRCQLLFNLSDVGWDATYQPSSKRWAVTVEGNHYLTKHQESAVSYVYEDTQTVEWNVNK
jgi:hypothetical protein